MDTRDEATSAHSSSKQVSPLLEDPAHCQTILQLCLERTDVLPFLSPAVQERIAREYHASQEGAGTPTHSSKSIGWPTMGWW